MLGRLPVRFTFDNSYYSDRYQGVPVGGYNQIIGKMLEGCDVLLDTDFFGDEERYRYIADKVVYTGMIDEFYQYRYGALEYRSLTFETEVLDTPNFQGNAVVHYTSADVPFTRITEHNHLEFGTQEKTVITREFPVECNNGCEPFFPVSDEKNAAVFGKYRELAAREKKVIFGGRLASFRYLDMWQVVSDALRCSNAQIA